MAPMTLPAAALAAAGARTLDARSVDDALACLATMPDFVAASVRGLAADRLRRAPRAGGFALVEHVWHLADLEREGYAARIARILAEEEPSLPDFDGERIARERGYRALDVVPALAAFAAARAANLARIAAASPEERARTGVQEGVGRIALAGVARSMVAHDLGHRAEIEALVAEIARG